MPKDENRMKKSIYDEEIEEVPSRSTYKKNKLESSYRTKAKDRLDIEDKELGLNDIKQIQDILENEKNKQIEKTRKIPRINIEDIKSFNTNEDNNKKKKKKKKVKTKKTPRQIISIILLVLAVPLLGLSIYEMINYHFESTKTKELTQTVIEQTPITEREDNENVEVIPSNEHPDTPYWNFIKMNLIDVDFSELKKTNPSTVGWITVGGTNVNYPIVQAEDNDYYLTRSFDNSKNSAGWIFMDYRNDSESYGYNTIIYGHNRADRTMFGSLKNVLSKSWYNTLDNRVIKMSSEKYNTLWQIYSIYTIATTNDYIQTNFSTPEEYQAFIDLVKGRSRADFNTAVSTDDKTLTLSTCYGDSDKLVVHAKLIKIEAK